MKALRTLIADDEPLARSGMSDYVSRVDFLQEVGQVRNGFEALEFLAGPPVDLLLLDVQMPGLSGTELVEALQRPPAVIFTTAHPNFAVQGFELDAVDYLLKPIPFPRFLRAAVKARERVGNEGDPDEDMSNDESSAGSNNDVPQEDLFIREEGRVERIRMADILYAESMQNYCRIYTTTETYLPLLPLKELEAALPEKDFYRIHRGYLVNLRRVEAIVDNQVRIGDRLLPVSRGKRENLQERLVGDRLL